MSTRPMKAFAGCCALAVLIAELACADEVRHLANAGDDNADGKTPATAWRTVEKLNRDLPAGATALLKRGDTFYGCLRPAPGFDAARRTTVAAYGEGEKPVITCVKVLKNDPSVWKHCYHCFWRTDLSNPANYTGLETNDCNVGFLIVDSEVRAWRRYCPADLVTDWDFSGVDGWLYVHATNNPAYLAKDIRVALNVNAVEFRSHTAISNVAIRATGAHGMQGGWTPQEICEDVRISDCDFENIGGAEHPGYALRKPQILLSIRYGNGIEFGSNCREAVVERCTFRGVYDVAVTMQGHPRRTSWRNIHFRDCTMTDCSQAFEIWCHEGKKGLGFENCSFTGNRTLRVGGGWGAAVRPERVVATPLLIYGVDTDTVDIDVSGNVFEDAPRGLIYKLDGPGKIPKGYRVHDNVLKKVAGACGEIGNMVK